MIRTISAAAPKAADVLALAGRLERSRNSEDAAYDVHPIAVAAGRLLDFGESQSDPHIASFAMNSLPITASHNKVRARFRTCGRRYRQQLMARGKSLPTSHAQASMFM